LRAVDNFAETHAQYVGRLDQPSVARAKRAQGLDA
jgi:hypothetical protein